MPKYKATGTYIRLGSNTNCIGQLADFDSACSKLITDDSCSKMVGCEWCTTDRMCVGNTVKFNQQCSVYAKTDCLSQTIACRWGCKPIATKWIENMQQLVRQKLTYNILPVPS